MTTKPRLYLLSEKKVQEQESLPLPNKKRVMSLGNFQTYPRYLIIQHLKNQISLRYLIIYSLNKHLYTFTMESGPIHTHFCNKEQ
uniref:Uncharacterized protein n=1 Tax=Magallana gigas TaxID=29159 RepID=K1QN05_MAGGI